jgi:hypothetical protein
MISMIFATALMLQTTDNLPNGLMVDPSNFLNMSRVIYEQKDKHLSAQQELINKLYIKQMKRSKVNWGLNDTSYMGQALYTDKYQQKGKVNILLDMTYRYNEGKE